MSYGLGIDLGTTFTAAATLRRGQARILPLGAKADTIPSVVLLREDETVLTGDAAARRGGSTPQRLAREFKRRFGQPEPILLGGTPYSPEALTAMLLRAVVDLATEREGGPPARICLSHPANWGPFKCDLLRQVVRLSGVTAPVQFTTEPGAAAVFYAREQRVEPGSVVAVYDLGGGTFDAAVLRKTVDGFEILGQPEGIEQLGGIDVDAAVFHHVTQSIGDRLAELDEDDQAALAAVARLKLECVEAKESLSSDTDTAIPVLLPGYSADVRLTRAELEGMVRPMLGGTIHALRRALESARIAPDDITSVLLVGGASRMPIVAQLVGAELGRPVAIDAHPKHAVALGAAWLCDDAPPSIAVQQVTAPPRTGSAPMPVPVPAPVSAPVRPVSQPVARQAGPPAAPPDREFQTQLLDLPPGPPPGSAYPPPAPRRRAGKMPVIAAVLAILVLAAGGFVAGKQLGWFSGEGPSAGASDTASSGEEASGEQAELDSLVEADRGRVQSELLEKWAPQLAVRLPGEVNPNGNTYDYPEILTEFDGFRDNYDILLVWTDDYPSSFVLTGAYAMVVARTFETPEEVLTWCTDEGFPTDKCFARRVSESGVPDDNQLRAETDETVAEPTEVYSPEPSEEPLPTEETVPTESTEEPVPTDEATPTEAVTE